MNELATSSQGADESVLADRASNTAPGSAPSDPPTDEVESEDDGGNDDIEVEQGGQKYRVPKALKDAFLRQADYTRKTQEIAEKGRSLEQSQATLQNQERLRREHLSSVGRIQALNDELAKYDRLDWQAFKAQEPERAQKLSLHLQQMRQTRDAMLGQLQTEIQQKALEAQRDSARRVEERDAALTRDIKDWNKETLGKVKDFGAREFGFEPEEIAGVTDPRLIKVLHRAYLGEQAIKRLAASEQAASIESLKPLPTVTGNGRTTRGPSDDQSVEEWMRRRNEQSRKKGH